MSLWTDVRDAVTGTVSDIVDPLGVAGGVGDHGDIFGGEGLGLIGGSKDPGFDFENPGTINLAEENPELWAEIQRAREQRDQFGEFADDFLDPDRFAARSEEAARRAQTSALNQYGRMGLAGSSTAAGGVAEASRRSRQAMEDQRLQDTLRLSQMEAALSGGISTSILAGQGTFSAYQNALLQQYLGQQAAQGQKTGQIMGLIGTGLGAYFGGPAGAAAGSQIGSNFGGGMGGPGQFNYGPGSAVPTSYNSPYFGNIGGGYAPGYGL